MRGAEKVMEVSGKVKECIDKGIEVSRDVLSRGVDISKKALSKAGDAVQDFGDKSVIRMERHQAEQKRHELVKELGGIAVDCFIKNAQEVLSAKDEKVAAIIKEIVRLDGEIARRNEVLEGSSADVSKTAQ